MPIQLEGPYFGQPYRVHQRTIGVPCPLCEEADAIAAVECEYDSPDWVLTRFLCERGHSLRHLDPEAEGEVLNAATERIADIRLASEDAATDARIDEMRGN